MSVKIRKIELEDNQAIAAIIRASLAQFDVPKEGTVYSDPTTDDLYELFKVSGSVYFVVEENGMLLGGSGVYPTAGLPEGYAEFVKFYLSEDARGKGLGRALMQKCFDAAIDFRYTNLYLESFPQLSKAVAIYEKNGFVSLSHALGNSGHHACSIWMAKELIVGV